MSSTILQCFFHQYFLTLLFLLFPLFLLISTIIRSSSTKSNFPPSPSKLPIIGNLHQLGPLPHRSLRDLSEKHGSLMLLHLGRVPMLVVSSADGAREIMKTHDLTFASRPSSKTAKILFFGASDMALAPYGEHWRQMRKVTITNLLSTKMVQSFRLAREEEVGFMIEKISSQAPSVVNMSEVLYSFMNDLICRVVSGKFFREEGRNETFERLIKENILLFGYVCCGTDTSFVTLEWAVAELLQNPEAMKKLRDEVQHVSGGKSIIREEDLSEMSYLKAVIKEVLRLHPPAALLLPRESMEECEIQGYKIPKGARVAVNAWAIGRDPKIWELPEEFQPERFLCIGSPDFKGNDFEFIPFGAGRRICPAINFAVPTGELALANLVHRFDWELPAGTTSEGLDMAEGEGIITSKKQRIHLIMNLR